MKFIPLHTKNTAIIYKNSLCSTATMIVLIFLVFSVMIPVVLVSLLSPYSGIVESRVLYEQPQVQFKFQHLFVGHMELDDIPYNSNNKGLQICSSFGELNVQLDEVSQNCKGVKYWTDDVDYDGIIDKANYQLQLRKSVGTLKSFDLSLFFEAKLKHKCLLSPPAALTMHIDVPSQTKLSSGTISLKADLQLKQQIEFTCPFPLRNTRTHFRQLILNTNYSYDLEQYKLENIRAQLKVNPAYFYADMQESYFRRDLPLNEGLKVELELNIMQVGARYHLSIWERLGQFWLYFASFFGISFYIMNRLKDFLFGNHIIRSWEIIPWKKLY